MPMWHLTAKEQGVILLVIAIFLTGALVKGWRASHRSTVGSPATIERAHGQDVL
jgi:hypothetical protein